MEPVPTKTNFLRRMVIRRPILTSVLLLTLIVVCVVLIIIVITMLVKNKEKYGSSNFMTAGNNPLWWHGSLNAGRGGSVDTDPKPVHIGHFDEEVRKSTQPWVYGEAGGICPAGSTYVNGQCEDSKGKLTSAPCVGHCDATAILEEKALSAAGAYPDTYLNDIMHNG